MFYLILFLIVFGIIGMIYLWIEEHIRQILIFLGAAAGIAVFVLMMLWDYEITLKLCAIIAGFGCITYILINIEASVNAQREAIALEKYKNQAAPFLTPDMVCEKLEGAIATLSRSISSCSYTGDQIPLGRANAFLSHFKRSIFDEEPLLFLPISSSKEEELREYGVCITNKGIRIARYGSILFQGIYRCDYIEKSKKSETEHLIITYTDQKTLKVDRYDAYMPLAALNQFLNTVIATRIPVSYMKHMVVEEEHLQTTVDNVEMEWEKKIKQNNSRKDAKRIGLAAAYQEQRTEITQIRNYINGRQGHGYAAEYASNTMDRLLGKNPVNAAADLSNGRQKKDGADRIVGGISIQTKYCKSARETIDAAFKGNYVENGKMMQIEVPRDQYNQALAIMRKKIDNNEVPGAKPGDSAKDYVRKGYATYDQAHSIAQSGTIEGLAVDSLSGAVISSRGASVSAVISFAVSVWNGADYKTAAKQALRVFGSVMGKGTVSWVLTSQLTRTQGRLGFAGKAINRTADKISSSQLANTKLGKKVGLNNTTGKTLVNNAVSVAMIYGADVCDALIGKISMKQLFKNSVVATASVVVGAKAGAIAGSFFPGIGTIAGFIVGGIAGLVTGNVTKDIMDSFIEDDAKKMFAILKEEFIDVTMIMGLTQAEFDRVLELTLLSETLPKMLKSMFAEKDRRGFARKVIVTPAVIEAMSHRHTIPAEQYSTSVEGILSTDFQDVLGYVAHSDLCLTQA